MSQTPRTDARVRHMIDNDQGPDGLEYFARDLERELSDANQRIKRLEDTVEAAWLIIANVSHGDWTKQHPDWQAAAIRWRDTQLHDVLSVISKRREMEGKEDKR